MTDSGSPELNLAWSAAPTSSGAELPPVLQTIAHIASPPIGVDRRAVMRHALASDFEHAQRATRAFFELVRTDPAAFPVSDAFQVFRGPLGSRNPAMQLLALGAFKDLGGIVERTYPPRLGTSHFSPAGRLQAELFEVYSGAENQIKLDVVEAFLHPRMNRDARRFAADHLVGMQDQIGAGSLRRFADIATEHAVVDTESDAEIRVKCAPIAVSCINPDGTGRLILLTKLADDPDDRVAVVAFEHIDTRTSPADALRLVATKVNREVAHQGEAEKRPALLAACDLLTRVKAPKQQRLDAVLPLLAAQDPSLRKIGIDVTAKLGLTGSELLGRWDAGNVAGRPRAEAARRSVINGIERARQAARCSRG